MIDGGKGERGSKNRKGKWEGAAFPVLSYGWSAGNLNPPISIQQVGKNSLSSRQCKLTGKALKSSNFSPWRLH